MVSTFKEEQNPHSVGKNITGFTEPLLKYERTEPYAEHAGRIQRELFQSLQQRGLKPSLVVSDANKGLVATSPPGDSWQRCKVFTLRSPPLRNSVDAVRGFAYVRKQLKNI